VGNIKKALDESSSKLLPHVFNSYTKQLQSPEIFMAQPIHFHRGKAATQSKLKFPIIAGDKTNWHILCPKEGNDLIKI